MKFLRRINRETPKDKTLHLIADNDATHKHPRVQQWLAKYPRLMTKTGVRSAPVVLVAATLAGFGGVLVILRAGFGVMQVGSGFAFCIAFVYAICILLVRMKSRMDGAGTMLVWTRTVGLISMMATAPFV